PRFDIELWNLFDRVKKDIPRTNNDVESWHSRIKFDARQNLTVAKVVELFRLEQNYTETNLVNLFNGDVLKKNKKKVLEREQKLKRILESYDQSTLSYHLDGLANLFIQKKKVKLLNGSVPENKEQLLSDWCKYFSDLLNNESSSNETSYPEPSADNIEINTESISFEEVEEAVRTFKNKKAPGNDYALTSDILKEGELRNQSTKYSGKTKQDFEQEEAVYSKYTS
ncbi:unnamed protein product, partial [Brachionus calyciflorus]